jgi:acetyl-CoA acetyltransferase family protein
LSEAVIVDAIRTPFGRKGGSLRRYRPDSLLAGLLASLVGRQGLDPAAIDDVIAGCVTQAGEQGANVGRLAVMLAGFPETVPGVALNRMCGSSQQAVHMAAQAVAAGDADYVIGCGVESMSRVPMFLDITLGQGEFRGFEDLNPALFERYPLVHQVESAERIAQQWGLTRSDCDGFAKESHRRAQAAIAARHNREIFVLDGQDATGTTLALDRDEGVRATIDDAKMAALAPVFRAPGEGVVTAANSSQLADGAGAVLVGNRDRVLADGLRPKARFRARVAVGSDPVMQLTGVMPATHRALSRAGLTLQDLDWIEINEAFATVPLAWLREFPADPAKVNPWGGAIAHGHPLGGTGAALMAKMLAGLQATDGQFGLQVMCVGHGMATATVIERL